uniref:Uncharacterized protein n=1 Tax=Biomphalaria glabrata TaxID=6526 RepID=A0A2C9KAX1_BIOGL
METQNPVQVDTSGTHILQEDKNQQSSITEESVDDIKNSVTMKQNPLNILAPTFTRLERVIVEQSIFQKLWNKIEECMSHVKETEFLNSNFCSELHRNTLSVSGNCTSNESMADRNQENYTQRLWNEVHKEIKQETDQSEVINFLNSDDDHTNLPESDLELTTEQLNNISSSQMYIKACDLCQKISMFNGSLKSSQEKFTICMLCQVLLAEKDDQLSQKIYNTLINSKGNSFPELSCIQEVGKLRNARFEEEMLLCRNIERKRFVLRKMKTYIACNHVHSFQELHPKNIPFSTICQNRNKPCRISEGDIVQNLDIKFMEKSTRRKTKTKSRPRDNRTKTSTPKTNVQQKQIKRNTMKKEERKLLKKKNIPRVKNNRIRLTVEQRALVRRKNAELKKHTQAKTDEDKTFFCKKRAELLKEKRAQMTEEEKILERKKNTERKKRQRASMTEEQKSLERKKNAERKKLKRAGMKEEDKSLERKKNAELKKLKRSSMKEEDKSLVRKKNAEHKKLKRAGMKEEDKSLERKKNSEHKKLKRAGMKEEDKSLVRKKNAEHKKLKRSSMKEEDKSLERKKNSEHKKLKRASMKEDKSLEIKKNAEHKSLNKPA